MLAITCLDIAIRQVYAHFGSKIFAYEADYTFYNVSVQMTREIYLMGFTTAIKLAKDWIQNQQHLAYISQQMKEKEKQYLEAELNFLRSQIQPHFFFNTLNNLYSLTLKKSDQAPEVVLKLSDLMSYMLYESNTPKISLNKEITYLQNYLDLEKLRFGRRLHVSFEIEGQIADVCVPPLIFILFVENSFKHGAKNIVNKIQIDISLKVEDEFLFFRVQNPVSVIDATPLSTGIGLKNVRRRLELLYADNYNLETVRKENEYIVSLKIPV
jgi:LytS/YehU family sensor histidine kinase